MVSEARKKKRRKLNRRRKRMREKIAHENLEQQRLSGKKVKQETTLFFTVDETKPRRFFSRKKRESVLSARSEMAQISDSQFSNAESRQVLGGKKKRRVSDKKRIYNLEKQRRKRIKRKNEKIVRKVAENNLQQQRLREEMPENPNVDAQQNLEEQRRIDIEKQRKEERLRLDQIQPTVLFDELSRPGALMKGFGFRDCDGF